MNPDDGLEQRNSQIESDPISRSTTRTVMILMIAVAVLSTVSGYWSATHASVAMFQSQIARSIWSDSTIPGTTDTQVDSSAGELGVKFRSSIDGYITGVRFYKGTTNTGTHIGNLWASDGTLLATAVFTNETASGWQEVSFANAVHILANTTYVASYHTNVGHYAFDANFFSTSGVTNLQLEALAEGEDGSNGVFASGASAFPSNSFNSSNYWVDVAFTDVAPPPPPTIVRSIWTDSTVPSVTDTQNDSNAVELGVKFRSTIDGFITGVRFYKGATNTGTHIGNLWASDGTLMATATFTNETGTGWQEVSFASPIAVTANTTYVASYHTTVGHYAFDASFFATSGTVNGQLKALADGEDGPNGVYVYGASAFPTSTFGSTNYWVDLAFIKNLPARSVWDNNTVPGTTDTQVDSSPNELGVKFQSRTDGFITGIRFYKGATNTGVHIGNLWSRDGTQLATATFSNETATGWQEVTFANAVQITANTTYVASYHTNVGHYAVDQQFFAGHSVTNDPLKLLADGEDGGNGVFSSGASAFPNNSFASSNYWVDVVFSTTAPTPPPPPTIVRSIWNDSTVPTVTDTQNDSSAVELGVKFRSSINGFITGVRFYKGTTNTGSHIGNLWKTDGTLLATAVFTNETGTGWQEVSFGSPVAVTANTTYIASYHTNVGHYAFDAGFFAIGGTVNGQLKVLGDGEDGANGVFVSGASAFPTNTFNSANYWVDVAFLAHLPARSVWDDNTVPGTTDTQVDSNPNELGVKFRSAVDGFITGVRFYKGATNTGVHIGSLWATNGNRLATATFTNETSTGWQEVAFSSAVAITANTTYIASYHTNVGHYAIDQQFFNGHSVTNDPLTFLADGQDGGNGVFASSGSGFPNSTFNASNYWVDIVFSTTNPTPPPPPPPPDNGPGGPVLVIASAANPFTRYYGEILKAEGLNEYLIADISTVDAPTLANYDVVILGDLALSDAQVTLLTNWVNGGGNLIAMHPDKKLAGLLGLTDANSALSNGYLLVNTANGPGVGIVNQTIQYHSTADLYTLNGATSIAALYSDAATATQNPAVTVTSVGANGGHAAAFTFDLARSIVYTRQGNPAWAGQERDGTAPKRSDDMFFGQAANDPQIDWVNLDKVTIPQADEQQRLLVNMIESMNAAKKPLPRFWYLPRGLKAAVVMTGDDHGNGGTAGRFDQYAAASQQGCSVDDWGCIRGTSYIYPNTPITNAQVAAYNALGFEIGLHLFTECSDWTAITLQSFLDNQQAIFTSNFPGAGPLVTNRTHCIAWSDWATEPKVELSHGIRFDTNYYYWPGSWVNDRPGFFTGSGFPMRFADLDGSIIDVYQAATQMTDESGQSFPFTIDSLLDKAIGSEGYYGVFTANMHTDQVQSDGSDAIVASAQARGVPVVSSRQMLTWLDGRNKSSFGALLLTGNTLTFTITPATGSNGLQAMVPVSSSTGTLTGITLNGNAVNFTVSTIKGVQYAMFTAGAGSYVATYGAN